MMRVGNGSAINAWEDRWASGTPLSSFISYRFVHSEGFTTRSSLRELSSRFEGVWPNSWVDRFPQLATIQFPILNEHERDGIRWDDGNGPMDEFSVRATSAALSGSYQIVPWTKGVWFKGHIAKHAFCMWTACLRRLPTQDRMLSWNPDNPNLICPLCEVCMDSHNHLFFECQFSNEIWTRIKFFADIEDWPDRWDDVLMALSDANRLPNRLGPKLYIAAAVFFIWRERNNRLFRNEKRDMEKIIKEIRDMVHFRLAWTTRRSRPISNEAT